MPSRQADGGLRGYASAHAGGLLVMLLLRLQPLLPLALQLKCIIAAFRDSYRLAVRRCSAYLGATREQSGLAHGLQLTSLLLLLLLLLLLQLCGIVAAFKLGGSYRLAVSRSRAYLGATRRQSGLA